LSWIFALIVTISRSFGRATGPAFERRQIPENCRHGLGYGRLKQISTDNMSFRDIFSSSFERQLSPAQQSTFLLIEIPVPAGKTTINP